MIEEKLTESGRDPRNVQALAAKDPHGREMLTPRDVDGVFIDCGTPENPGVTRTADGGGENCGESRREESDLMSSDHGSLLAAEKNHQTESTK